VLLGLSLETQLRPGFKAAGQAGASKSAHDYAMRSPEPSQIENSARRPLPREVDCVIVGGGAAGLSAAVNMGRMRRSVLLIDERDRFLWHHVAYNVLGFPDGVPAVEIRRLGWRHAAKYGARLVLGHVATVARDAGTFRVTIHRLPEGGMFGHIPGMNVPRDAEMASMFDEVGDGGPVEVVARTVVLATGVAGHFPEFPGRNECVGHSLFWCLHCEGYESIDRVVGVVGHDDSAVQTALDLLVFTGRVTLVAGRQEGFDVPASRLADLAARGIAAHACGVAQYENRDGQMQALVLDDPSHTRIAVEQVYTIRSTRATGDLARQLGLELTADGQTVVTSEQHTNVPGVYAAGDATSLHDHQLSAAMHEGNQAACGANYYLYDAVQKSADEARDC
jgi:thioredoxin reductase (NADPH)